jgi:peptidoglycan glycosyltransferase
MHVIASISGILAVLLLGFGLARTDHLDDREWLLVLGASWLLLLLATRIRLPLMIPTFNRSLIRTTLVLATVFVVISAQLVRVQVTNSDAVFNHTAIAPDGETIGNPRLADQTLSVRRGQIYDRDGNLVAGTTEEDGQFIRYYPDPTTGYVAGYYSPLLYGTSGLEATWNDELTGRAGNDPLSRVVNGLLNRPQSGANLHLTLDADLQQQASSLLGGNTGSVVVMDAFTGEVLVLASNPSYDPNQLFTTSPAGNEAATSYWESLLDDPRSPLVQRATLGLFTPGSTFKTITAAIGIELGLITPDQVFEDNGQIDIDGRILVENNRPDDSRTQWTVREGVAWSLNVVFAQIGLLIGADQFWDAARQFGFDQDIPFDLPVEDSQVASSEDFLDDDNALADTAFGQGQLQVTPLFMCMVTGAFINGGEIMEPFLVAEVVDENGRVTNVTRPAVWQTPISANTATQVEDMMVNAVNNGAVRGAQIPGYTVGGKTGTAETGDGTAHSWFIGFIGDDEPRYTVAVVLEGGSGGLSSAVSIGRDILQATILSDPAPE